MKKVILIIIFFLNVVISYKNNNIHVGVGSTLYAQCDETEGMVGYGNFSSGNNSSGNGFFNWLSTAFGNAWEAIQAVGDFFSGMFTGDGTPVGSSGPVYCPDGTVGEFFAQEDTQGNVILDIDCENTQSGWLSDPFSDPFYQNNYNLSPNDTYLLNNIDNYYNYFCCHGSSSPPPPTPYSPPIPICYTTLDSDTTKYYKGDTIFVEKRESSLAEITVHRVNGNLPTMLHWNSSIIAYPTWNSGAIENFNVNTIGDYDLQIDSIGSNATLHYIHHNIISVLPTYYITVNNDPTKYFNNDTIYVQQKSLAKLTIHKAVGNLSPSNLLWKRNDTTKCSTVIDCNFDVSKIGTFNTKVDSGTIKTLISNVVKVYKKPTVYFKLGANYNGEYGFDDSTHRYLKDSIRYAPAYEVKTINHDTTYYVPWMSLLSDSSAVIRDSIAFLSPDAKKDRNGYVDFKPSNSAMKINGLATFRVKYIDLNTINNISLSATEWISNVDSTKSMGNIFAINNVGDTIGKMHLSCANPIPKKIVYVYVNHGTGYDTLLTKERMLQKLNRKSHNQFMRKWVIDSTFVDTLNVAPLYATHPQIFNSNAMPGLLATLYKIQHGVDIDSLNSASMPNLSSKIEFFFISKFLLQDSIFVGGVFTGISTTTGSTTRGRFGSTGSLFSTATLNTVAHEHGHALDLLHTKDAPYNIPEFSTDNILDYFSPPNPDLRKRFSYFQWKDVY